MDEMSLLQHLMVLLVFCGAHARASEWESRAVREEIRPRFEMRTNSVGMSLMIETDEREAQEGWWSKEFSVQGGKHYRFRVLRKLENVESARRSGLVRILWRDEN